MSSPREYPIFSDTKGTSETQIRFKTQANGNRETGKKKSQVSNSSRSTPCFLSKLRDKKQNVAFILPFLLLVTTAVHSLYPDRSLVSQIQHLGWEAFRII